MGRIAVANAGRIDGIGTYIEFNNNSNKLTGIPFETATAETASISFIKGGIRGYVTPLPNVVTTIFRCGANTNGIKLLDMELLNLTLPTGYSDINDGPGKFETQWIDIIAGGGNPTVPLFKGDAQNLLTDPNFTADSILDWYITADTGVISSRTTAVNINLTKDTTVFRTGGAASMKVAKLFGIGSASEIKLRVPISKGKLALYKLWMYGAGLTGSIFVTSYYATTLYTNSIGVPLSARTVQVGPIRTIDASTLSSWVMVTQQMARNYTPWWATHLDIKITLSSMSGGSLYIDDAKVTEL
jgi:uncharacterized membrane protein YdcZ (DUF606 family)